MRLNLLAKEEYENRKFYRQMTNAFAQFSRMNHVNLLWIYLAVCLSTSVAAFVVLYLAAYTKCQLTPGQGSTKNDVENLICKESDIHFTAHHRYDQSV